MVDRDLAGCEGRNRESSSTATLDPWVSLTTWSRPAPAVHRQAHQMAGMKGLIQNTAGETIEVPIISSMNEGLESGRILHVDARRP